jgi:hypothetical protein
MKKFFLLVCAISFFTSHSVMADTVVGVQVEVKKGTKEWNADRTKTECVGKGLCEFTIGGTVGSSTPQSLGTLGWINEGTFGLSLPADILRDAKWSDTFVNGYVTIQQDLSITPDVAGKIKNCPRVIKAGKYGYKLDGKAVIVYFQ